MITRNFTSDSSLQKELVSLMEKGSLVPIIGSGFTRGCSAKNGFVPDGDSMKEYMINELVKKHGKRFEKESLASEDFSSISTLYESEKHGIDLKTRRRYIENNFIGVVLDSTRKKFININWPCVYTLNIDDAIESNSHFEKILPMEKLNSDYIGREPCVFKLHGDARYFLAYENKQDMVFKRKMYIASLKSNEPMLTKLESDVTENSVIYIGCGLSDEIDIIKVSLDTEKDRRFGGKTYFVGSPNPPFKLYVNLEENFNIDEYIEVDDYSFFYDTLINLYSESSRVKSGGLANFRNIQVVTDFSKKNINNYLLNQNYIYTRLGEKKISIPCFSIQRSIEHDIMKSVSKCPITLVYGHRISGKTYVLLNVLRKCSAFVTYFFPSNTKLDMSTFHEVLGFNNCILIFDTNTLDDDQISKLIEAKSRLGSNGVKVVLVVSSSTKNADLAISAIGEDNAKSVNNTWSINEITQINDAFKDLQIPFFDIEKKGISATLLDNLYKVAALYNRQLIDKPHVSDISKEDMLILILLAFNEEMSFDEIRYYRLSVDIVEFKNRVEPIIIFDYVKNLILKRSGLHERYVISANAHFLILSWIGQYASNAGGSTKIVNAYVNLVKRLKSHIGDDFAFSKAVKRYIRFEDMNDIFSFENSRNIALVNDIYAALEDDLCFMYQYNHQRAIALYRSVKRKEDIDRLSHALDYIKLAMNNVGALMQTSRSPYLPISYSHIHFTYALILGKKCMLEDFNNRDDVRLTLSIYYEAVIDERNKEYAKRLAGKDISDLRGFVSRLSASELKDELSVGEDYELAELIRFIREQ